MGDTITNAYRKVMTDNQYIVLRWYRDNDIKGNGKIGIPRCLSNIDVKICVSRGWLIEKKVGVAYLYKVSESGLKALNQRDTYLNNKMTSRQVS